MIEQALRFDAILRSSAQPQTLRDCFVDQLLFGRFPVDKLQRFVRYLLRDFFELEIAFKATAAEWSLFHFERSITKSKPLVVKITIFFQPRNDRFDNRLRRTLASQQSLAQLCN